MSDKTSNSRNTIKNNDYTHDLIKELKDLNDGENINVQTNLEKIQSNMLLH